MGPKLAEEKYKGSANIKWFDNVRWNISTPFVNKIMYFKLFSLKNYYYFFSLSFYLHHIFFVFKLTINFLNPLSFIVNYDTKMIMQNNELI